MPTHGPGWLPQPNMQGRVGSQDIPVPSPFKRESTCMGQSHVRRCSHRISSRICCTAAKTSLGYVYGPADLVYLGLSMRYPCYLSSLKLL